jgi:hypothetical protein
MLRARSPRQEDDITFNQKLLDAINPTGIYWPGSDKKMH